MKLDLCGGEHGSASTSSYGCPGTCGKGPWKTYTPSALFSESPALPDGARKMDYILEMTNVVGSMGAEARRGVERCLLYILLGRGQTRPLMSAHRTESEDREAMDTVSELPQAPDQQQQQQCDVSDSVTWSHSMSINIRIYPATSTVYLGCGGC